LRDLFEVNIIDDIDDIDALFRTLVIRFCFLLDIQSDQLPLEFYERLKNDLATQQLLMLELQDHSNFFETKKEHFTRVLCESEERARARMALVADITEEKAIMCIET
jgi:hypothetical protein